MLDLRALPAPDARAPAARPARAPDGPSGGFEALLEPLDRGAVDGGAGRALNRGLDRPDRLDRSGREDRGDEGDRPDRAEDRAERADDPGEGDGERLRGEDRPQAQHRPGQPEGLAHGVAALGLAGAPLHHDLLGASRGMGVEAGLLVSGVETPELPEGVRLRRLEDVGALIGERLRAGDPVAARAEGSAGAADRAASLAVFVGEEVEQAEAEPGSPGSASGAEIGGRAVGSAEIAAIGSGGARGEPQGVAGAAGIARPTEALVGVDPTVAARAERVADLSAAMPAAPAAVRLEVQDGAGRWTLGVQRSQQVVSLEFSGDAALREVVRGAERELEAGIARHGDRLGAIHWRAVDGVAAGDMARSGRGDDPGRGDPGQGDPGRGDPGGDPGGDRGGLGREASGGDRGRGDLSGDRGDVRGQRGDRGGGLGEDRRGSGGEARARGHLFERVIQ